MLSLISCFQERLAQAQHQQPGSDRAEYLQQALTACQQEKGQQWDPKLVEMLDLMVAGLQQGLSLPTIPTKITLTSGLLNPDVEPIAESYGQSSTSAKVSS
jgi:hypothetical protein